MSVMTGSCSMDWEYHLNLDHILKFNDIKTTYNHRLCKKVNTLIKVKPDMDYVKDYANDLIERDYCIHVLNEEAINTSSLLPIPESVPASKASASATLQVNNTSPAAKEERETPLIADSTISEPSVAETMMERIQIAQEAQTKTNEGPCQQCMGL